MNTNTFCTIRRAINICFAIVNVIGVIAWAFLGNWFFACACLLGAIWFILDLVKINEEERLRQIAELHYSNGNTGEKHA